MRRFRSGVLWAVVVGGLACKPGASSTTGTIQFVLNLPTGLPESVQKQISLIEIVLDETGATSLFTQPVGLTVTTSRDGVPYETQVTDIDGDGRYEFFYGVRQNYFSASKSWSIVFEGEKTIPAFKVIGRIYATTGLALVLTGETTTDVAGQPIQFGADQQTVVLTFACEPLINCGASSDAGVDAGPVDAGLTPTDAGTTVEEFGVMSVSLALPTDMSANVRDRLGLIDFYFDETGSTALFSSSEGTVTGLTSDGIPYERQVTDVEPDGRREFYVRLLRNPFDGGGSWSMDVAGTSGIGAFNVRGRLWNSDKSALVATALSQTDLLARSIQFRADGGAVGLNFTCESAALCADPDAGAIDAGPGFAILAVAPARGPTAGGTLVTITAQALADPVAVTFGSTSGISASRDGGIVTVTTPAALRGFVDLTLSIPDASITLDAGFEYYDPVSVLSVAPSSGYFDGGGEVTIAGFGLIQGTTVTFGGAAATVLSVDPNGSTMTVRPPAGPPLDPVAVTATNTNGTSTKADAYTYYQIISTFAGGGPISGVPATEPYIYPIQGVFDPQGRLVFPSYQYDHRIYRIEFDGTLTLVAGSGESWSGPDGPATTTAISNPYGLAFSDAGELYFSEYSGHVVRKIMDGGIVRVAGTGATGAAGDFGPATSAAIQAPAGIAFDSAGRLLITQYVNNRVRRIDSNGIITTVAGTGVLGYAPDAGLVATQIALNAPTSIVEWPPGSNEFVVAENGNGSSAGPGILRYVDGDGGTRVLVGGGADAAVEGLYALNADTKYLGTVGRLPGGDLLLSQNYASVANRVLRYNASSGTLSVLAGTGLATTSNDGLVAASNRVYQPYAFASPSGTVYFSEYLSGRIRTITDAGLLATVAGNLTNNFFGDLGPATSAGLYRPAGVARDPLSGAIYIADRDNHRIRKVVDGGISTVAGNGTTVYGGGFVPALDAGTNRPIVIAVDSLGNVYATLKDAHRVIKVYSNGYFDTIAGTGSAGYTMDAGASAIAMALNGPYGIAVHPQTGDVYFTEFSNHVVRRVTSGGSIYLVAGTPGAKWLDGGSVGDGLPATSATLDSPTGIAFDLQGNLLIADYGHHRLRRVLVDAGDVIETVAGNGDAGTAMDGIPAASALLNYPHGLCVDSSNRIFITINYTYVVRRIARNDAGIEMVRAVAGSGTAGFRGDNGFAKDAILNSPGQIACLPGGDLLVADYTNNRIRIVH